MNSPLAKVLPSTRNEEQLHDMRRRAWQEHGILVVSLANDRLDWVRREQAKQLGEFLYGKRGSHECG